MYRDRTVSLNRIIRDIKRHITTQSVIEQEDGTLLYIPNPDIHISDIVLHAACWEPWYEGKYIVRVDELAVKYTDEHGVKCNQHWEIRYDCFCDDPEIHNAVRILYNDDESSMEYRKDPYIRVPIGQKAIIQHIDTVNDSGEQFWIRVNVEQDSFTPPDSNKPAMYHKLSVANEYLI